MGIAFGNPYFLWLFPVLAAAAVWIARRSLSGLAGARRKVALGIRLVVILILTLLLADPRAERPDESVAVAFCVDYSRSVPEAELRRAAKFISEASGARHPGDRLEVVAFGGEAAIEQPFAAEFSGLAPSLHTWVDPEKTAIGAALRLAASSFAEGAGRRVVLITDGNENRGDVVAAVEKARAAGVAVDLFPIRYKHEEEVLVEKVTCPDHVTVGRKFELRCIIHSTVETTAEIDVLANNEATGGERLSAALPKGAARLTVLRAITGAEGGAARAEATVDGLPLAEGTRLAAGRHVVAIDETLELPGPAEARYRVLAGAAGAEAAVGAPAPIPLAGGRHARSLYVRLECGGAATLAVEHRGRGETGRAPAWETAAGGESETTLVLNGEGETKATLFVPRERMRVKLRPGKNAIALPQPVTTAGLHSFQVRIAPERDTVTGNNRAFAYTYASGDRPTVLLLDDDPASARLLLAAMASRPGRPETPFTIEHRPSADCPQTMLGLASYDAIVLSNVPAAAFSDEQKEMLHDAVHEFGVGLIMVGGGDAFGAGGYQGSAVEAALPVNMDVTNRKVTPKGALVLVLHTMEIPGTTEWGKRVAKEAIGVLGANDVIGVLYYDARGGGERWLINLQPARDKDELSRTVDDMVNGDAPDFGRFVRLAHEGLTADPRAKDAVRKHVIVISDGDPARPSPKELNDLASAGITLSTVLISGHGQPEMDTMRGMAEATGGRFYNVLDAKSLPRIFIKESAVVRRGMFMEETQRPRVADVSQMLQGIGQNDLPPLTGYVTTSQKRNAAVRPQYPLLSSIKDAEEDPILAQWEYGVGRAVAFTSDLGRRWATPWVQWGKYDRFWRQVIEWTLKKVSRADFESQVAVGGSDAEGKIVVFGEDEEGRTLDGLTIKGKVYPPSGRPAEVLLRQTALGRYEGEFDAGQEGAYYFAADAGGGRLITTGFTRSASAEYSARESDERLFAAVLRASGGREIREPARAFDRDLTRVDTRQPLWRALFWAALGLFFLDIAFRRLDIEYRALLAPVGFVVARLRRSRRKRAVATKTAAAVGGGVPAHGAAISPAGPEQPGPPAAPEGEPPAVAAGPPGAAGEGAGAEAGPGDGPAASGAEYMQGLFAARDRARRKRGLRKRK
ncbi:MAG: VWA domain-containing protein [Planctomycetes bacterium]|nr:VWA domain-containing protein [Planctomycetota bacterium]